MSCGLHSHGGLVHSIYNQRFGGTLSIGIILENTIDYDTTCLEFKSTQNATTMYALSKHTLV